MSAPEPNDDDLGAPGSALARSLREADAPQKIFVPPTLDEAILKKARAHFENAQPASRGPSFNLFFRWATGLAAAALITFFAFNRETREPGKIQFAREDINRDGQVDILDAMTLAKLTQAQAASPTFDQNADGNVDETDINSIAGAAVRLN